MATEKRKIHRVVDANGTLIQVLPETSAEQVTLADAGDKFTSTNVEGALAEVAQDIADLEAGLASAGKVDDVQDVNGASIVTNKIAKLSKAAVGLGNVDNTADANKSVKYAGEAGKATNDSAGNKITDTYATKNELSEGLAGRATTKTYENYQAFVTAMGLLPKSELKVGDNIYIKKLDVPDMWVTAVNATSTSYTYTNDQAIIDALDKVNDLGVMVGLTVGYFTFSKLETEKVDLDAYQTKTDNTLETTSKTVVGAINEVKDTADNALTKANANATDISNIKDGTTKVKKAETADNATNVTTNINGHAIADIFDKDGTTVKKATRAGTADMVSSPFVVKGRTALKTDISTQYNGIVPRKLFFNGDDFYLAQEGSTVVQFPEGLSAHLRNTGVTAGQYSAVNVDSKGRVTAGGKSIEWGTSGQTTPSDDLMVGGLFMELQP